MKVPVPPGAMLRFVNRSKSPKVLVVGLRSAGFSVLPGGPVGLDRSARWSTLQEFTNMGQTMLTVSPSGWVVRPEVTPGCEQTLTPSPGTSVPKMLAFITGTAVNAQKSDAELTHPILFITSSSSGL